jgi:subtilisin family serine protease
LVQKGVTSVVAAGNEAQDAANVSPARTTEAITVGATDINDTLAGFSNYGTLVDILAPGVNILSSWNSRDYEYVSISGTSMGECARPVYF